MTPMSRHMSFLCGLSAQMCCRPLQSTCTHTPYHSILSLCTRAPRNMPRLDGSLLCDGTSRLGESGGMRTACNSSWRETVLRAAATGGDLLFVIRGITHHSYNDVLLFFGHVLGPIIKRVSSGSMCILMKSTTSTHC